jgi:hypothetical protein
LLRIKWVVKERDECNARGPRLHTVEVDLGDELEVGQPTGSDHCSR